MNMYDLGMTWPDNVQELRASKWVEFDPLTEQDEEDIW